MTIDEAMALFARIFRTLYKGLGPRSIGLLYDHLNKTWHVNLDWEGQSYAIASAQDWEQWKQAHAVSELEPAE